MRSAASATGRRPTWLDRRPKTRSAAITATKYATAVSDRSAWLSPSVRRYSSYSGIGLADAANTATSEHAAPAKPIRDPTRSRRSSRRSVGFLEVIAMRGGSSSGGLAAVDDHGVADGERRGGATDASGRAGDEGDCVGEAGHGSRSALIASR